MIKTKNSGTNLFSAWSGLCNFIKLKNSAKASDFSKNINTKECVSSSQYFHHAEHARLSNQL